MLRRRRQQDGSTKLKSLEFGNGKFGSPALSDLTPLTLRSTLDLHANSLERVKFVGEKREGSKLLSTFAEYSFPRLTDLEVDIYVYNEKENLFSILVDKNRNLKRLKWLAYGYATPTFPNGTFPNLERLEFEHCNNVDMLESMMGKLPNLKILRIYFFIFIPNSAIDELFLTLPKLKLFYTRATNYRRFEYFWRLRKLTDLSIIQQGRYENKDFVKIARSFPRLRNLKVMDTDLSRRGIKALATLKKLRKLELWHESKPKKDKKNAFENFAACKHLEIFRVHFDIRLSTIFTLIRNCAGLREISVQSLLGADSPGAIAAELLSLNELGPRNIDFKFSAQELDHEIWGFDPVKAALEKLKSGGFTINIIYGDPYGESSYSDSETVLATVGGYETVFRKKRSYCEVDDEDDGE